MSGLELLGAVTNVLHLTEAIYQVIKDCRDLPDEFKQVGNLLPLAQETLSLVKYSIQHSQVSAESAAAIEPCLASCNKKTADLERVFGEVRKWEGESACAGCRRLWDVVTGKARRAVRLMVSILTDIQALAILREFEGATRAQVEELKKAIADLEALQPDEGGEGGGSQTVYGDVSGKLFYQQGSGTINAPDGDIIGILGTKIVGRDERLMPKSRDAGVSLD